MKRGQIKIDLTHPRFHWNTELGFPLSENQRPIVVFRLAETYWFLSKNRPAIPDARSTMELGSGTGVEPVGTTWPRLSYVSPPLSVP